MNRTLAILLLFLSVLFTACQSDEPVIDDGGGKTDGMNIGYIAVNIVQPTSVGARSRTETTEPTGPANGFEYGSDDENKAEKALFFLFKGSNDDSEIFKVNNQSYIEVNINGSGTGTSPEVERIYNTVLMIDGVDSDPTNDVKSIVCVLNAPVDLKSATISKIFDLKTLIKDYSASTPGTFIMTNSVYASDGNITTPTSKTVTKDDVTTTESFVKKSAAAAQQDPVDIYVERVVAKVEASFKSDSGNDGFNNEGAKPTIDGVETQLGIIITGIEVANIAKKSYLFKNVTGASSASEGIWSETNVFDATNKRSYWEIVPAFGTGDNQMQLDNKSYKTIVTESTSSTPSTTEEGGTAGGGEGTEGSTHLQSIVDRYTNNKFFTYIQPNTLDNVTNEPKRKTCILVTAQLTKTENGTTTPMTNLAYIRGGYTTLDGARNVVAAYLAQKGYYKRIEETTGQETRYEQLSASDLEWKNKYSFAESSDERTQLSWLKDYEVVAQINTENVSKLYNSDGTEAITVANANKHLRAATDEDAIAKNYRARVFTDGKCYYFMEIDHSSVLSKTAGTYPGVVRNHIYRLTLESIKDIGTPVFNPEDIIIPQRPDNETTFYLGARVNVLAWKLATQNVNFEGN